MTEGLRPGVLFDVDGTLCDTNYLHALAWSRVFRDVGEWAPTNAIHRLIGMEETSWSPSSSDMAAPKRSLQGPSAIRSSSPTSSHFHGRQRRCEKSTIVA